MEANQEQNKLEEQPSTQELLDEQEEQIDIPEELKGKWNIFNIVKDNWMFFVLMITAVAAGWFAASQYYQNQVVIEVNKAIDLLPLCSNLL